MRHIVDGSKRPRRNGDKGLTRKHYYALYRSYRLARRLYGENLSLTCSQKVYGAVPKGH